MEYITKGCSLNSINWPDLALPRALTSKDSTQSTRLFGSVSCSMKTVSMEVYKLPVHIRTHITVENSVVVWEF